VTIDDFVKKYTGIGVDTDGAYGFQCMDLMHQYCIDVLGISDKRVLAAPTAKDVFLNFNAVYGHEQFDLIPNTPTGVPKKGDILFWGTGLGPAGHVAIYLSGDVMSIQSFDQNFPTGSKPHTQNHSYKGILGWLRVKQGDHRQDILNQIVATINGGTSIDSKVSQVKFLAGQL